jgi:hypothetical protein
MQKNDIMQGQSHQQYYFKKSTSLLQNTKKKNKF